MTGAGTGGHRLLNDLFATDVQDFRPFIDEIEAAIRDVRAQPDAARELGGNVYTLTIGRHGVTIANARDRRVRPETVGLDAFEAAFRAWRQRTDR